MGDRSQPAACAATDRVGAGARQLGKARQPRTALDQAEHGARAAPAMHGVGFPVTDAIAPLDLGRPMRDPDASRDVSAPLAARGVTLAIGLWGAQTRAQIAPAGLVGVDMLVDGLMAIVAIGGITPEDKGDATLFYGRLSSAVPAVGNVTRVRPAFPVCG